MSKLAKVTDRGNSKTEIDILNQRECDLVRSAVHDLKLYWELANAKDSTFFKLGASSYVDMHIRETSFKYYALARSMNPILMERFNWLYARLSATLQEQLGTPTRYEPDLCGLPGFHIYQAPTGLETFDLVIHFDGQVNKVNFESLGTVDTTNFISFTLPVAMPKSGAGLNMWDVRNTDITDQEKFRILLDLSKSHYQAYRQGSLFVHYGNYYHQVAALKDLEPGEERITLQGHAVLCEGVWILFW